MLNMLCTNFLNYSVKMISVHRTDASSRNSLMFLLFHSHQFQPVSLPDFKLLRSLNPLITTSVPPESSNRLLDQRHNLSSEVLNLCWDSSVWFEMTSQLCIFRVLLMWVIHCTTCESWNVDFLSFGIRGNTLSMFSSYLTNSLFSISFLKQLLRSAAFHRDPF